MVGGRISGSNKRILCLKSVICGAVAAFWRRRGENEEEHIMVKANHDRLAKRISGEILSRKAHNGADPDHADKKLLVLRAASLPRWRKLGAFRGTGRLEDDPVLEDAAEPDSLKHMERRWKIQDLSQRRIIPLETALRSGVAAKGGVPLPPTRG